jgi:hypothetical protein
MIQTLDDAEALLFLEKNFEEMFNRMPADEVAAVCKRELSRLSQVRLVWCKSWACLEVYRGCYLVCMCSRRGGGGLQARAQQAASDAQRVLANRVPWNSI